MVILQIAAHENLVLAGIIHGVIEPRDVGILLGVPRRIELVVDGVQEVARTGNIPLRVLVENLERVRIDADACRVTPASLLSKARGSARRYRSLLITLVSPLRRKNLLDSALMLR